jgi:hypothetical protein
MKKLTQIQQKQVLGGDEVVVKQKLESAGGCIELK